ncbi:MAG: hypothetical protein U0X20_17820 [Caldilineaceae bacterium]
MMAKGPLLIDAAMQDKNALSVTPDAVVRGVLWQVTDDRFRLDAPGIACYDVGGGRTVTIEPAPGATGAEVARILGMAPLAALLYQRGCLAFHAAACVPPLLDSESGRGGETQGAILLAGSSGAGKSTLLAALVQRGWRAIADELAIVDLDAHGRPIVFPHPSPIRLWPDVQVALEWAETPVGRLEPPRDPQPLQAIYWIGVHNRGGVEASELSGVDRFRAIGSLMYNTHIADALLDRTVYLHKAGAIAQTVSLHRLGRPREQWCIDALVDKILTDSACRCPV